MPIGKLSLEARVVYSVFLGFMLVGYATSLWFYLDDELGVGPAGAVRHYLGDDAAPPPPPPEPGGPSVALPDADADLSPIRLEQPARQVMETFHFHLFSVSICALVLMHLFMMCSPGRRTKIAIILGGALCTLTHLLVPPLTRFVSPGFAWLMFPSALGMTAGWLAWTLWPLWEMWRPTASDDVPGAA